MRSSSRTDEWLLWVVSRPPNRPGTKRMICTTRTIEGGSDYYMRRRWEDRPDLRVSEFGVPWLRMATEVRRKSEAAAARRPALEERLAEGIDISLEVSVETVERLAARGESVDREDAHAVGAAVLAVLGPPG